jgi:very-short-patch-repair endonuclease
MWHSDIPVSFSAGFTLLSAMRDLPPMTSRARDLRRRMDLPEVLLWSQLRRQQLQGLRFRRQHPIGPYVLDFYCREAGLAVEVDGYSHDVANRPERDRRRDDWLAALGVQTLRIPAREVLSEMDGVLATIAAAAIAPQSLRDSSP